MKKGNPFSDLNNEESGHFRDRSLLQIVDSLATEPIERPPDEQHEREDH
jgi:hypothetical protein